jgi:restriction endonuclease S subunit
MITLTAAERRFQDEICITVALTLAFRQLTANGTPSIRLGDIATTCSGGTPSREVSSYFGGDIPWIKSGDLTDGPIESVTEYLTEEGLRNSAARIFPSGTVVVALYGATVGKTGILRFPAASNQAVCSVAPNDSSVLSEYLFWFLRYKRRDFLKASFGGAQPNISQGLLRDIQIPLPTPALQAYLADFFATVDQLRANTRRQLAPLPVEYSPVSRTVEWMDAIATRINEVRLLVQETSVGFDELCRSVLRDSTWGEPFLTPMSELVRLRVPDVTVTADGNYQFAGVYCFGRGVFVGQHKTGMDFQYPRLTRLREHDFVYPKLMAWEGALAVVPPECDGLVVSTEFPVFEIDQSKVLPEVLDVYFRTPSVWPALSGASTGTNVRRKRLNPADFLKHQIPLPSRESQQRLREIRSKLRRETQGRVETIKELDAMLPAILHSVFQNGELGEAV